MILSSAVRAYICAEPIDMRKSIDGLAALMGPLLGADAFSGQVFVFVGRRRNKVTGGAAPHGVWHPLRAAGGPSRSVC